VHRRNLNDEPYAYMDEYETHQIADDQEDDFPYKVDVTNDQEIEVLGADSFAHLKKDEKLCYKFYRFGTETINNPEGDLYPILLNRNVNNFESNPETKTKVTLLIINSGL